MPLYLNCFQRHTNLQKLKSSQIFFGSWSCLISISLVYVKHCSLLAFKRQKDLILQSNYLNSLLTQKKSYLFTLGWVGSSSILQMMFCLFWVALKHWKWCVSKHTSISESNRILTSLGWLVCLNISRDFELLLRHIHNCLV